MKGPTDWRWIISMVAVMVWAFMVLTLYYIVHKPFELANAAALLSASRDLFIAALVVYAGASIGLHCLTGRQDADPTNASTIGHLAWSQHPADSFLSGSLERLVLAAGLGLGILGLIVFGVSMTGALYRPVMWALLVGGVILGRRNLPRLIGSAWQEGLDLPAGRLYRFVAVFVAAMLLVALSQALLPPTAWDSLAYHLTGPKLYIQAHRFIPDTDIVHLGFPAFVEMLYTLGMSLAGSPVAQIIDWAFAVLTLLLLYALARRRLAGGSQVESASCRLSSNTHAYKTPALPDTRTSWLAMALLLSAPTIVMLSFWAYIDVALMFYELSAVCAFLHWRDSGDRRWLIAAGAFYGFGMSAKYTAVSLVVALALLVVWDKRKAFWREGIGSVLWLGGTAALVTLPWLLKNGFLLGNPFYPFVFGGIHWDALRQVWYAQPGTGLAYTAPWQLLTAPWEMTIFGIEGKAGFSATIGPLYLIGLFVLPFVWRPIANPQKHIFRPLLVICGIQYLLWLVAVAQSAPLIQTRLLLPAFPLLAILAASAFVPAGALRRPQFAVDWILNIVLVLALALNLMGAVLDVIALNPLAYVTGWESKTSYLERRLGWYTVTMDYINQELSADARIYFLWEPRSFYCDRPCRPDPILDAFPHLVYRLGHATAIADYLREDGYTHVLLYKTGLDFLLTEENAPIGEKELAVLRELQDNHLSVVYEKGEAYILYRLKDGAS